MTSRLSFSKNGVHCTLEPSINRCNGLWFFSFSSPDPYTWKEERMSPIETVTLTFGFLYLVTLFLVAFLNNEKSKRVVHFAHGILRLLPLNALMSVLLSQYKNKKSK